MKIVLCVSKWSKQEYKQHRWMLGNLSCPVSVCWLHFLLCHPQRKNWIEDHQPDQTRPGCWGTAHPHPRLFSQQIKGLWIRISGVYVYLCTFPALVLVGRKDVRKWRAEIKQWPGSKWKLIYSLSFRERHQQVVIMKLQQSNRSSFDVSWFYTL